MPMRFATTVWTLAIAFSAAVPTHLDRIGDRALYEHNHVIRMSDYYSNVGLTPVCITDEDGRGAVPSGAQACVGGIGCGGSSCVGAVLVPPSAPAQHYTASAYCPWSKPMRILMVHTGKTAGTSISQALKAANINWTIAHAGLLTEIVDALVEDYDMYIVATREPVSRTLSAFNWLHFDGGGAWESFNNDGVTVPNTTRKDYLAAPIVPAYNDTLLGALSACFAQLPGGASAFAESFGSSLPGASFDRCTGIAHRALTEGSSGTGHLSKGYGWYLSKTAEPSSSTTVLDRMRAPGKHVFHVSQENFDADLAGMFKWLCVPQPNVSTISTGSESPTSNRSIARHADTAITTAARAALEEQLSDEYYYLEVVDALSDNHLSSAVNGLPRPLANATASANETASARPTAAQFYAEYSARAAPKADNPVDVVPACAAPKVDPADQRVRRAIHTLSRAERDKVYAAMWVMHDVPTWEGRRIYGAGYLDWSELTVIHSVAVVMPEGDSAHPMEGGKTGGAATGLGFVPWHRAFDLLFENVLLLIDPTIGAAPYWDMALENTHPLFTAADFGSVPGVSKEGRLLDGAFANWTVTEYDFPRYAYYLNATSVSPNAPLWNEKLGSSRKCDNLGADLVVVRKPATWNLTQINIDSRREGNLARLGYSIFDWSLNLKMPLPDPFGDPNVAPDPRLMSNFTEDDAKALLLNPGQTCWLEAGPAFKDTGGGHAVIVDVPEDCVPPPMLHHLWHNWVGGVGMDTSNYYNYATDHDTCDLDVGDANDFQAAVNDPTFFFHHINIDRSLMAWHVNHPEAGYHLNFPTRAPELSDYAVYGHRLNDIMSYLVPFRTEDLFPSGLPNGPTGAWTVADLLCYTQHDTAPYTYDTIVEARQAAATVVPLALDTHTSAPAAKAAVDAVSNISGAEAPNCALDHASPMYGFNPRGEAFPPAPPHTFSTNGSCALSGQSRRVAIVHVGKTSGSTVHGLLAANGVNFTEYELGMGPQLEKEVYEHDFFILTTRDPLARSVSAFNFDHLVGGGSEDVNSVLQERAVHGLPTNCTSACDFCIEADTFSTDPATNFENRTDGSIIAPYLVPNMSLAPLVTPCDYDSYSGALPTGPKPLMASMYTQCFAQLPGGVSAWAEALDAPGTCGDLARRHLHETSESMHMNYGFEYLIGKSGLLDRLRAEAAAPPKNGRPAARFLVVRLENFDDDVAHMWEQLCVTEPKAGIATGVDATFPRHSDTTLSTAADSALRAHLSQEYHTLNALLALAIVPEVNAMSLTGQSCFSRTTSLAC